MKSNKYYEGRNKGVVTQEVDYFSPELSCLVCAPTNGNEFLRIRQISQDRHSVEANKRELPKIEDRYDV